LAFAKLAEAEAASTDPCEVIFAFVLSNQDIINLIKYNNIFKIKKVLLSFL
jgi:hypothetical protein